MGQSLESIPRTIVMAPGRQLHVKEFQDETRWRWELQDEHGAFLGDHEVKLERAAPEARGFFDLRSP
jgi:hypothetical protein